MNKIAYIILLGAIVAASGIIFSKPSVNKVRPSAEQLQQNVEIKDGLQYITINARGGYLPKISGAQAGIPTKLLVKTNGTYDCSAALVIRSIGYQKMLSQTGEELIDLGVPQKGTLQGTCSMGMYNFKINFE